MILDCTLTLTNQSITFNINQQVRALHLNEWCNVLLILRRQIYV